MDNVSESLGLYDFFNIIGAGAIFLIHVFLIFPYALNKYFEIILNEAIAVAGLVALCFFAGLILQEMGAIAEKYWLKYKKNMVGNFLIQENIIDNNIKFNLYKQYARDILKSKELDVNDNFSMVQCEYVYAYIIYYIEQKGKNKKLEKMRALYGMSKLLYCSFYIILILCIVILFINGFFYNIADNKILLIGAIYSFMLMKLFRQRAKRCMQYRIRMAMGVYESCIESEKKERVLQNEENN